MKRLVGDRVREEVEEGGGGVRVEVGRECEVSERRWGE